jgi:hypothetical protein
VCDDGKAVVEAADVLVVPQKELSSAQATVPLESVAVFAEHVH